MPFLDRADAGRRLGALLADLRPADPVVLAVPRGGVPVAVEVARALDAPLDVLVVRKLGLPFQPELAMGAVGEDGVVVVEEEVVRAGHVDDEEFARVVAAERAEMERRIRRFRGARPAVPVAGRTVIVVDDGVATGSTARAACRVARERGARRVVLAVPVAATDVLGALRAEVEVVCVEPVNRLWAVGEWYRDFDQVPDERVAGLLRRAGAPAMVAPEPEAAAPGRAVAAGDPDVLIDTGDARLAASLFPPTGPLGTVVFAHGSASSRHSPRNRYVAGVLGRAGLGTLLLDMLTEREAADRDRVFDIGLLGRRLAAVTGWLQAHPLTGDRPIHYFGASTGAAAALWAAAEPGAAVASVVSRGGRPDLAGERLADVVAPTLLIVGSLDEGVVALNRAARDRLGGESRLVVVPGASHLFEEPGTLAAVAQLALDWFTRHSHPLHV